MAVYIGATKDSNKIVIEKVNYFGENEVMGKYNSKVIYRKGGKLAIAVFQQDTFNHDIYFPKKQPKDHKVHRGLYEALYDAVFYYLPAHKRRR